ncbi:transposase [Peribacillus cavernae]|uniref:Transposase n=2 Tax=Peribacillus cavernae TaxID=1674310 RepID=A0A433HE12_9BACI|nr:transposase [Peribacillus cavernae]RUQ26555.1 transposase [Peribacillus cavernae]
MNKMIAEERKNKNVNTERLHLRQKILKIIWDFKNMDHQSRFEKLHHQLLGTYPEVSKLDELVSAFRDLFRNKDLDGLKEWINEYENSRSSFIQSFIRGIKKDQEAVSSSIKEPWSNGIVEGHVNRLKTIKRMMYGRAGFQVLKNRVLYQW